MTPEFWAWFHDMTSVVLVLSLALTLLGARRLQGQVAALQRGEGLHEWSCPNCDATTRARMADR